MKAPPNFAEVAELAGTKGRQRLALAKLELEAADQGLARAREALAPLVGSRAAQSLTHCDAARRQLAQLDHSMQQLAGSLRAIDEQGHPVVSEDYILRETEQRNDR